MTFPERIFTNVAIYRFLTQTAPYTNTIRGPTEREAHGGLGHVAHAHHIHVILFEGASCSTAALHNGKCFSPFSFMTTVVFYWFCGKFYSSA